MICSACRVALRTAARSSVRATTTTIALTRSLFLATRPLHTSSLSNTSSHRAFSTSPIPRSAQQSSQQQQDGEEGEADAQGSMTPTEQSIASLLRSNLTGPITHLLVQDISGGCGSMYAVEVTAEDFRGKTMLKQQRMVNAALGDVIKGWHGVQIRTAVPE